MPLLNMTKQNGLKWQGFNLKMLAVDFFKEIKLLNLPISDAYDLAAFLMGISYNEIKQRQNYIIPGEKTEAVLTRLKSYEPVAYITGRKEFYGREFIVDKNVLIPRVDTEILVEAAINAAQGGGKRILDLCCGSGCIGLTILAETSNNSCVGVDISGKALQVAENNALKFGLSDKIDFICADALNFQTNELFDIITCNPPYVTEDEYVLIEPQVKYEPKLALTASEDGLVFYKNVLRNIHLLCKNDGQVFLEIGATQGAAVTKIADSFGLKSLIMKDLAGFDRVIKVTFTEKFE